MICPYLGAYISLTSVILVDLVGLDSLTNAFGLMLLFQGIASLVGAPIAGEFFELHWRCYHCYQYYQYYHCYHCYHCLSLGTIADRTGSYDGSFHFAGVAIFISGIMLFPLPCLQRWLQRKETKKIREQHSELVGSTVEA